MLDYYSYPEKKDVKGSRTGTLDLVHIIIKNLLTGTGKY